MPDSAKRLAPIDLKAIFGLEPTNDTWHWQEILHQAHDQAFTVAKAMRLDLLSVRAALETALQQGQTLKQFTTHLKPVLQAQGWWGQQIIVDSQGTAERVQLGSARRLKTIYHTNLQSAYIAGRKASMEQTTNTHPYWMLIAVLDGKTRPSHRELDCQVFRHDDPVWSTIYPPNGFNCSCRVIALSEAAVKRRGLTVISSQGKTFTETIETGTDKRTGEIRTATVTGIRLTNPRSHHHVPNRPRLQPRPRHRIGRSPKTKTSRHPTPYQMNTPPPVGASLLAKASAQPTQILKRKHNPGHHMLTIELEHQHLQQTLKKVEWAIGDLAPLMRGIAAELASQTEQNFENEGRPQWAELSDTTTERRSKNGNWPGQILQVSAAGLAASITTYATDTSALIGSNKPYAAMMQQRGEQSDFPNLWGDIPARPFLPMDTEGKLLHEAEVAILALALNHMQKKTRV